MAQKIARKARDRRISPPDPFWLSIIKACHLVPETATPLATLQPQFSISFGHRCHCVPAYDHLSHPGNFHSNLQYCN